MKPWVVIISVISVVIVLVLLVLLLKGRRKPPESKDTNILRTTDTYTLEQLEDGLASAVTQTKLANAQKLEQVQAAYALEQQKLREKTKRRLAKEKAKEKAEDAREKAEEDAKDAQEKAEEEAATARIREAYEQQKALLLAEHKKQEAEFEEEQARLRKELTEKEAKAIADAEALYQEKKLGRERQENLLLEKQKLQREAMFKSEKKQEKVKRIQQHNLSPLTIRTWVNYGQHLFLDPTLMAKVQAAFRDNKLEEVFEDENLILHDLTELTDLKTLFEREQSTNYLAAFGSSDSLPALKSSFENWKKGGYKDDFDDGQIQIKNGSMFLHGGGHKIYINLPPRAELFNSNVQKRKAFFMKIKTYDDTELSRLRFKMSKRGMNTYNDEPRDVATYMSFLDGDERNSIERYRTQEKEAHLIPSGYRFNMFLNAQEYFEPMVSELVLVEETELETIKRLKLQLSSGTCLVPEKFDTNDFLDKNRKDPNVKLSLLNQQSIKSWFDDDCPFNIVNGFISTRDGTLKLLKDDKTVTNEGVRLVIKGYTSNGDILCGDFQQFKQTAKFDTS